MYLQLSSPIQDMTTLEMDSFFRNICVTYAPDSRLRVTSANPTQMLRAPAAQVAHTRDVTFGHLCNHTYCYARRVKYPCFFTDMDKLWRCFILGTHRYISQVALWCMKWFFASKLPSESKRKFRIKLGVEGKHLEKDIIQLIVQVRARRAITFMRILAHLINWMIPIIELKSQFANNSTSALKYSWDNNTSL
jgi:hypothetical protein